MPGIIEWPVVIRPRSTSYAASTMDLFPTVADLLGLPTDVFIQSIDGISLKPHFTEDLGGRCGSPANARHGRLLRAMGVAADVD